MAEQKEQKHWAAEKAARDRLLAFGTQHGLDSTGVLEVLGIKKMSDHKGTEAEAIGKLVAWAKQQAPPEEPPDEPEYQPPAPAYEPVELSPEAVALYDEACRNLGSVPVWIRMDGRGYYEISVQAWLAPALTRVGLAYAHQALEDYQAIFADVMTANGNGNGAKPALQLVQPGSNGDLTFQATQLIGSMMSGKVYWNVIGPRFPQYGVRIWPEVLKASGFDPETLDPAQQYPLEGYTATYVEKEKDDKLIADKVVKLEKAA